MDGRTGTTGHRASRSGKCQSVIHVDSGVCVTSVSRVYAFGMMMMFMTISARVERLKLGGETENKSYCDNNGV